MSTPSKRQLAGAQRRTLRAMRSKLVTMAAQWDGVDQFCLNVLEELADQCEKVAIDLQDDSAQGADR